LQKLVPSQGKGAPVSAAVDTDLEDDISSSSSSEKEDEGKEMQHAEASAGTPLQHNQIMKPIVR
jgi:hypothetical protein